MIIQAELRRKQSECESDACVVDEVIELPAQRFKQFSHALLAGNDHVIETGFGRLRRLAPSFLEQTQGQQMFQ